jgi:predicted permease
MLQDFGYALRALWRTKGFTAVAAVCLCIGIGLNTTIFSIVDGVLLKPFPYTDPDRLVVLRGTNAQIGVTQGGLSFLDLRDLQGASRQFEGIAASAGRSLTVSDGAGDPERYEGAAITWNLFPLLGVAPALGQGFTAEHDRPGGGGVVLLSHSVWSRRYESDPGIVGRAIVVNGVSSVVVGVMPERFEFPENQKLWIPMTPLLERNPRNSRGLFVLARLAPGAAESAAQSEITALAASLAGAYPDTNRDWSVRATTLREAFLPDDVTLVIWIMMAAATLVLFIACSNVANLLLARATARRREISVRAALGAGRGRILRQLVTESVALALVAVPFGIVLAQVGTRAIYGAMPVDDVPYYITWSVDWRVLAYTLAVAVSTAVLFGLLPALQVSRGNLHEALKEGTRGNSVRRSLLRSGLVVAQVSLALVALVGALLFVRTFVNLDSYAVGFDPKPLMTMRFFLPGEVYEAVDAKARRVQDIVERLEALPGVEAAFASNLVPMDGGGGGGGVLIDGRPAEPGRQPFISFTGVTPHFHDTLGVSMSAGRGFTEAEGWSRSPVAIVNETMSERFWPGASPLGARFRLVADGPSGEWFTIIGVAPDVKHDGVDPGDERVPAAYVPYIYQQAVNTGVTIRVAGDPASIAPQARAGIRAADPTLPIFAVHSMDELRRLGYWEFGLFGWIFGAIGVGGLVLAAIGVYGVLSYAVSQRTQEIGVRIALGAGRGQVIRLIVGHGAVLALVGIVVGIGLAALAMPAAQSLLYNVSPFDPASFAAVSVFLAVIACAASYLPALRATRVDPLIALRGE